VGDARAFLASKRDALKRAINEKYWMDDLGAYALALDRDGSQVRTVSSDVSLGLYYGAFDDDKARTLICGAMSDPDRLGDRFGLRTISREHAAYRSDGYHLGGVWPFQSPFAAIGARRYGEDAYADRLEDANVSVIESLGSLPEVLLADRDEPAPRGSSCDPQAWSAAAIFLSAFEGGGRS
jgi:glycogen debranching enzyme